jgi:hypothetical protein
MNFVFHCPNCGKQKNCEDEDIYSKYTCCHCGKVVLISPPGKTSFFCPYCDTNFVLDFELHQNTQIQCGHCRKKFTGNKNNVGICKISNKSSLIVLSKISNFLKVIPLILLLVFVVSLISWGMWKFTNYFCHPPVSDQVAKKNATENTNAISGQSTFTHRKKPLRWRGKVTREMVIAETKKALDISAMVGNTSYNRFKVELCTITETKAACHFSVYTEGVRYIGAIEFNITPRGLIPSGQFYFDRD